MNNVLPNQESRLVNNKPALQTQDIFLTMLRKDQIPVMIFLVTGIKLIGRIRAFDKYAVLLENDTHNNNQEQLIYKHAIATVTFRRGGFRSEGHYRSTTDNDDHSSASFLPLPG